MTVPLPSIESHRWQSEIQLWWAYEEWWSSAELHSYLTSGSMCWIISASLSLVQCIMRRYVCSPSELSVLCCSVGLTCRNHCPSQRQWVPGTCRGERVSQAGSSCFLWLLKHRGSALWLPWRDLLLPTFFVMGSPLGTSSSVGDERDNAELMKEMEASKVQDVSRQK